MNHRERVEAALNHDQPDRCPMQISFTPEFAHRLEGELRMRTLAEHNPHGGGNTYALERALEEDMLLTSVGWANSYYMSAGDYTDEPFNQGAPYDFSKVFEGARYAPRRRRFWPALSKAAHGRSLGYCLEVSYDAGLHWCPYVHPFNNLVTECGVWLSADQLDVDTWVAALKGALKFRITASVVSDERLTCIVADGPVV